MVARRLTAALRGTWFGTLVRSRIQEVFRPLAERFGGRSRGCLERLGMRRVRRSPDHDGAHIPALELPLKAVATLAAAHLDGISAVDINVHKRLRHAVGAFTKEALQGLIGLDHDVGEKVVAEIICRCSGRRWTV